MTDDDDTAVDDDDDDDDTMRSLFTSTPSEADNATA